MTDHDIEVAFEVKASASCGNTNVSRDWAIIMRMAAALCPPGTPAEVVPPMVIYEAQRCYLMICAMRTALEEEVAAATKLEKVE